MLKNISYGDSILFAKVLIICEISEENFEAVNAENADEADFSYLTGGKCLDGLNARDSYVELIFNDFYR